MEELQDYTEQNENNFDFKTEIYKYLVYWKWLLLGLILGGVVAYLYNRYNIPKYRTEASMMILNDQERNVMNALPSGGSSILSLEDQGLGNQIETLKSKSLISNVVDELNHNISYFIEGNLLTVEAYKSSPVVINFFTPDSVVHNHSKTFKIIPLSEMRFELQEESSGFKEEYSLGEPIEIDGLQFSILPRYGNELAVSDQENPVIIKISPIRNVANNYISGLEIDQKGQSKDILTLSIVQESPEKSQDFLNALMIEFNAVGVRDKRRMADTTSKFVQKRLEDITTQLDSVEKEMAGFKRDNRIMDVTTGAQEFQSLSSQAEQEIFNLETQLILIKDIQESLRDQRDYGLLPADLGIEAGKIPELIASYNQLIFERNTLLRNATPENPLVQAVSSQLDKLEDNLQDNFRSTIRSINVRLEELGQRERTAEGVFSTFPGLERGIRGIERQQQIKEQLYLFLLQRREEAAISSAATADVAKIIDPAFTSKSTVGPKPLVILLGGLFIGFLIPIVIIFIKNMLDTKIHHKGDLQILIKKVPFIGEIPQIAKGASDVIQKNDRSVLAESFRILRTNLNYMMKGRGGAEHKVIFVTSSIKGEGKTFITYNLARTLAASGKKVLLVGADIRNPQLHRYAEGLRAGFKGLSEYLYDDKISLSEITNSKKGDEIPVDIILSGRIPPNPAELLINHRMEELLNQAKEIYDYILVDTAPTMLVTDTLLISPYADTTIYVTRAGFTEKGILNFAKDLYEEGKLKGMALVVNDVDYSTFGYAAKYGYSYNYGYGDEKENILKTWTNKLLNRK